MSNIRERFLEENFSTESVDIIIRSWRPGTARRYSTYIKQWKIFCNEKQINPISPPLTEAVEFLTKVYQSGVGYSSVATARSALSSLLKIENGVSFGKQEIVKRYMKGILNLRPILPKQMAIWDPDIVLNYIKNLEDEISLKVLSEKLVMLLSLLSGQRDETLEALNIDHMILEDSKCTFFINKPLKTTRKNFHQPPIEFVSYPHDESLCIIKTLNDYINITATIRKSRNLIISYKKPHNAVCKSTIARWCKNILKKSGINIEAYSSHSTRSASTSKAKERGLTMAEINKAAGWSSNSTFRKYYQKPIYRNYGNSIL